MNLATNAPQLGAQFRANREALGRTLEDIAAITGYRRQTIAELEKGGNVGLHVVMAAIAALGGKGLAIMDQRTDYDQLNEIFPDE